MKLPKKYIKNRDFIVNKLGNSNLPSHIRERLQKRLKRLNEKMDNMLKNGAKLDVQKPNIPIKTIRKQTLLFIQTLEGLKSLNLSQELLQKRTQDFIIGSNKNPDAMYARMKFLQKFGVLEFKKDGTTTWGERFK